MKCETFYCDYNPEFFDEVCQTLRQPKKEMTRCPFENMGICTCEKKIKDIAESIAERSKRKGIEAQSVTLYNIEGLEQAILSKFDCTVEKSTAQITFISTNFKKWFDMNNTTENKIKYKLVSDAGYCHKGIKHYEVTPWLVKIMMETKEDLFETMGNIFKPEV